MGSRPSENGFAFEDLSLDAGDAFLADAQFVKEFNELYQYYKDTHLMQLRAIEGKLLAIFQNGRGGDGREGVPLGRRHRRTRDIRRQSRRAGQHTSSQPRLRVDANDARGLTCSGRTRTSSILDEVFVETVGGDLTIKVENNTEDGRGVYREPVEEREPDSRRRRDPLREGRAAHPA